MANHYPVTVTDSSVNHRIAHHLEQEQLATADDLLGQREDVFDGFFGEDRATCCDPPEHGHKGRCRPGLLGEVTLSAGPADCLQVITGPASGRGALRLPGGGGRTGGTLGEPDLNGSRAIGITSQKTLALQGRELMRDAARAG